MYGMAIPILIPIAFMGIIVMYCMERMLLAYYHPKPPMYGRELNDSVIFMFKQVPIVMLVFGYWIMGNRQIFLNKLAPLTRLHVNPDPEHHLFDVSIAGITQDKMIFLFLFMCIAIKLYINIIKPMISSGASVLDKDLDIDEGL